MAVRGIDPSDRGELKRFVALDGDLHGEHPMFWAESHADVRKAHGACLSPRMHPSVKQPHPLTDMPTGLMAAPATRLGASGRPPSLSRAQGCCCFSCKE